MYIAHCVMYIVQCTSFPIDSCLDLRRYPCTHLLTLLLGGERGPPRASGTGLAADGGTGTRRREMRTPAEPGWVWRYRDSVTAFQTEKSIFHIRFKKLLQDIQNFPPKPCKQCYGYSVLRNFFKSDVDLLIKNKRIIKMTAYEFLTIVSSCLDMHTKKTACFLKPFIEKSP